MTIEQALELKLVEVLGDLVAGRIYPDSLPESDEDDDQGLPPSVLYQRAGDDDSVSLDGVRSPTRRDVYTLELWSARRADGRTFRELTKAAFSGVNCRGYWGGDGGVFVTGAVAKDAAADTAPPLDGSDDPDRAERLTLTINYNISW